MELIYIFAIGVALVSMFAGYFLFWKWQPNIKHKMLYGFLAGLIILAISIGIAFLNVTVAIFMISVLLPLFATWIWHASRPAVNKITDKHAKIREESKMYTKKNKKGDNE